MAGLIIPNTEEANKGKGDPTKATADAVNDALFVNVVGVAGDEIEEDDDNVHVFEVDFADIDAVKRRCNGLAYLVLEKYPFRATKPYRAATFSIRF